MRPNSTSKDEKYRFLVAYTFRSTNKSSANIKFVNNDNAKTENIGEVLVKEVLSDDQYPYLPSKVVEEIKKRTSTKLKFTIHDHTLAWKKISSQTE